MSVNVTLSLGTLPANLCVQTWQELAQAIVDALTGTVPDVLGVNYGTTVPSADNRIYPWIRKADTDTPDRTYIWNATLGLWLSKHPIPAGVIALYRGAANTIPTLDGGEDTATNAYGTAGPFWEIDTVLSGKFPLGVSEDHAIDTTGGVEEVTLTNAETALHTHGWDQITNSGTPNAFGIWAQTGNIGTTQLSSIAVDAGVASNDSLMEITSDGGSLEPGGEAHENMPPYYSLYFIKRSSRLYYRI